ncbi:hypothetical protein FGD67_12070 [Colwellia sp. M166]|uniref:hypothetical protein n=1 Tax=Colwellia sp. M166 TaxID=2583805 RepID=UPI00211E76FE|nr:hypothetical protein [Colwellia sp. M166]UUO23880.1 hypothetical protein FGD67_12070 [Colwellia sp. M166]
MKNYLLVLSTLLLLLTGCSKSVEVQLEPELTVFVSAGSDKTIQLTKQDAEYIMLSEWLVQNKADWLPTSGRYAGGIYLTSGNYGIQVIDTKVVLYSSITDNPTAIYAQEIERSDLRALKDLAK